MGYRVAVVGAAGTVGREILQILAERQFPADEVVALASSRSVGQEVSFGEDDILKIQDLDRFDFKGFDFVLSSPGSKISADFVPKAARTGAMVIDGGPQFRMDPEVPLVVPEVNAYALADANRRNIVASPNCAAVPLTLALKPLHKLARVSRVVVSTYQSVSGAGREAMDELFSQTRGIFVNDLPTHEQFTKQIAFNVIPHIDAFMPDGVTREEWMIMVETKKILDPAIKVSASCVRVPVFVGNALSANIEFADEISAAEAKAELQRAPGIVVVDHRADEGYVTPVECAGEDAVYVSRIRDDQSVENGINLWIVADDLRKGTALNAVQIAERLAARDF